jgi:hypothetical protein
MFHPTLGGYSPEWTPLLAEQTAWRTDNAKCCGALSVC